MAAGSDDASERNISDEALALRLSASGDADALAQLARRYRNRLIVLARRLLSSGTRTIAWDEAEDVAQEALVAVYNKRGQYRSGQPFRPWLYRITINRCLDRQRAQSRRPTELGWEEPDRLPSDTAGEPLAALLTGEREQRLQEAVDALPVKYRTVFLLRHLDDLSYDEIAMATGVPLATVKTHLFRARSLLRDALAGYLE